MHLETKLSKLDEDDLRCPFNVIMGGEEVGAIINVMEGVNVKAKAIGVSSLTKESIEGSAIRKMVKLKGLGG